jgi:hypothetical protein
VNRTVIIGGLRVREVDRQGPPDAAVAGDVADRIDDVRPGIPHGSTASGRARTADRDQARDQVAALPDNAIVDEQIASR